MNEEAVLWVTPDATGDVGDGEHLRGAETQVEEVGWGGIDGLDLVLDASHDASHALVVIEALRVEEVLPGDWVGRHVGCCRCCLLCRGKEKFVGKNI